MDEVLERLWNILVASGFPLPTPNPTGLRHYSFDYPGNFEEDYKHASHEKSPYVQRDISIVLAELSKATKITKHHISCLTPRSDSPALCIHYRINEETYSVAIPGVGYCK